MSEFEILASDGKAIYGTERARGIGLRKATGKGHRVTEGNGHRVTEGNGQGMQGYGRQRAGDARRKVRNATGKVSKA